MTTHIYIDILSYLQEFFRTASVILFLRCFYDSGFQWSRKKGIYLFLFTILCIPVAISKNSLVMGLLLLVYGFATIIIAIYDYRGKKLIGFLRYTWVYILFQLIATVINVVAAYYILPNFDAESAELSGSEELFQGIFCTIYFGMMFLLMRFGVHKKNIVIPYRKKNILFLILYFLLLFIILCIILQYKKEHQVPWVVLGSSFILATTLFPVFVYSLKISQHYQQRTKLQEVYLQSEVEHFRQYMHAQEETRRFRHDIRNNLLCMNEMVASGDQEKLAQYLKDLLKITDTLSFKYVSGDDLLDSILNSKAPYMEQQGIRFELDGVLAGGLPWKPMDICAVFANAVDNAIEACQKVPPEERHISMFIKSTPQFWLISIENSVAEAVDTKKLFQKNGGYTSKSDSSRHGIGTYSMRRTVESYGAIIEAKCTEQVYTLEIMIDKTKTTK